MKTKIGRPLRVRDGDFEAGYEKWLERSWWLVPGEIELATLATEKELPPWMADWRQADPENFDDWSGQGLSWKYAWNRRGEDPPDRESGDTSKALHHFLRLSSGTPAGVHRYAQQYGPMELCEGHARPLTYCRSQTELGQGCCLAEPEPLLAWRYWARRAAATIRLAQLLASGRLETDADYEDWAVLTGESAEGVKVVHERATLDYAEFPRVVALDRRGMVAQAVQEWLDFGMVGPRYEWRSDGEPTWKDEGSGLFGLLACQLALAVMGAKGRVSCAACQTIFVPKRKPRGRSFCEVCKRDDVDKAIRQQEYRVRKKAAQ